VICDEMNYMLLCWLSPRLWHALTYVAASMALTRFSPSRCCILVLMSSYVLHCSPVSTCLWGQSWHSLSSLGSQVCLCLSVSVARLWSLSLYIVSIFLSFWSVTQIVCHSVLSSLHYYFYFLLQCLLYMHQKSQIPCTGNPTWQ